MARDAQGFDPDENYTQEDNPFWDCTEGAHPAWWRGEEYGYKSMIRLLDDWLTKPLADLTKGKHQPDIQAIKERVLELRRKADSSV